MNTPRPDHSASARRLALPHTLPHAVPHTQPPARWRALMALLPWLCAAALLMGLQGCASPSPQDHAQQRPSLDLRQYFNGPLLGHGVVTDRSGRLLQRFRVDITGRWQGDSGTLDEHFSYSDGRQEQRVWTIQRLADGRYSGTAADVVGSAQGQAAGPVLNWRYTLRVPVDGRSWDLQFDDWMFLVDDSVMINRATMRKFGITVGEVLISFQKLPGAQAGAEPPIRPAQSGLAHAARGLAAAAPAGH